MTRNPLGLNQQVLSRYRNPDSDPRGPWQSVSANAQAGHATPSQFYKLRLPSGREIDPPRGRCWLYTKGRMEEEIAKNNIWFGENGDNAPRIKKFLSEYESKGLTPETLWTASDVGTNDDAKKSQLLLLPDIQVFDSPKPEGLLERVIHIATNPGDLVLDSFLGSGTTAAVAHKMGRRYIGIEMGDHAVTHCAPRLCKVIEGEQGDISEAVGWKGGGGFRFLRLGEPLFDAMGLINPSVTFRQLASFVWFSETRTPLAGTPASPRLGVHEGVAIDLLFNGILGDRRPAGGNVLTSKVLEVLPPHAGPRVIFGEASRLGPDRLRELGITFKQTPFDLKVR